MKLEHLKKLLNEHGITPNTRLDQYFLYDHDILSREVDYADINEGDSVLEIGPGMGTLTSEIVKRTRDVSVIEKDAKFKPALEKLGVNVIIGDALKVEWPKCNKILSNLPYSISSPLTFKILEQNIDSAVLCYQKEFANRMVAVPGIRAYSRLSVNCYVRSNVELLETVPKSMYYPQPKVDSAFVRLTPKHIELPPKFNDICRALFQHKNKKVRNALMDSSHEIDSDEEKVKGWVDGLWEIKDRKVIDIAPEDIILLSETYS